MPETKEEYPDRNRYFSFKKSDRVRYFKFKTRCPNCGKVCIEDFLADKDERIKRAPLINCHRCGYNTTEKSEPPLIWKRTPYPY